MANQQKMVEQNYNTRTENEKLKALPLKFKLDSIQDFLKVLPFALTGAQKRAAWEVFQD